MFRKKGITEEEQKKQRAMCEEITLQFSKGLKLLQQKHHLDGEEIVSNDASNNLCNILEAAFLHGIKDSVTTKLASYAQGSSNVVKTNFWSVARRFTHKDVIEQLQNLGQISTDVGLCRAWVRLALNDGLMASYLSSMVSDPKALLSYFHPWGYLLDYEQPGILRNHLTGLMSLTFKLSVNSSILNTWSITTLNLAGFQIHECAPSPVIRVQEMPSQCVESELPAIGMPANKINSHYFSSSISSSINTEIVYTSTPPNTPVNPSMFNTGCDLETLKQFTTGTACSSSSSQSSHPDPSDVILNIQACIDQVITTCSKGQNPSNRFLPVASPFEFCYQTPCHMQELQEECILSDVLAQYNLKEEKIRERGCQKQEVKNKIYKKEAEKILEVQECERQNIEKMHITNTGEPEQRNTFIHKTKQLGDVGKNLVLIEDEIYKIPSIEENEKEEVSTLPTHSFLSEKSDIHCSGHFDTYLTPDSKTDDDIDCHGNLIEVAVSRADSSSSDRLNIKNKESCKNNNEGIEAAKEFSAISRTREEKNDIKDGLSTSIVSEEQELSGCDALGALSLHHTPSVGNSLSRLDGWTTAYHLEESFETMLRGYHAQQDPSNGMKVSIHDIVDGLDSPQQEEQTTGWHSSEPFVQMDVRKSLESTDDILTEYEIISTPSQGLDTSKLEQLVTLSRVGGMCLQNYTCATPECCKGIGHFHGPGRICQFDGKTYCNLCHENQKAYIPAEIVYNWNFKKLNVCNANYQFLQETSDQPLLDIQEMFSGLYFKVSELHAVMLLRTRLMSLRSYMFTCSETTARQLRDKVWPREHLYNEIHTYSVSDLLDVKSNKMLRFLHETIDLCVSHIFSCGLCTQKGFICEICRDPKPIFPFDIESTVKCDLCRAVYHQHCKKDLVPCPKCKRLERRGVRAADVDDYAMSRV